MVIMAKRTAEQKARSAEVTRMLEDGRPVDFVDFKRAIEHVLTENDVLKESLQNVSTMLAKEDIGWMSITGAADNYGLELAELQQVALQIREQMVGNPHIKRGHLLRSSFIWDGGMQYTQVPGTSTGRGANVQARMNTPKNKKNFFGPNARQEREGVCYSDGNLFVLGDKRDWSLEQIPIWEINGDYRNPNSPTDIWAFRRTWSNFIPGSQGKPQQEQVWIRTESMPASAKVIEIAGTELPLDPNLTIFHGRVNGQVGFSYGIPDALSALVWAKIYKDFMLNGKIMSDALAQFAFQATFGDKTTASSAALEIADGGAGLTAVTGLADKLVPMSSAGKGYDFASGTALLAVVATSIELSVIHLSADPGTAGGSYGAASALDLPTQLAIKQRRQWHIEFDKRILAWMGAPDAQASFPPMMDATDLFRTLQMYMLKWNSGLYEPAEIKADIEFLWGKIAAAVPEGVLIPNNRQSWMDHLTVRDNVSGDPETLDALPTNAAPGVSPAPGQGQSSAAGKGPKPNDLRTDSLGEQLREMAAAVDLIEKMRPPAPKH